MNVAEFTEGRLDCCYIPRASVGKYKDTGKTISEIAKAVQVRLSPEERERLNQRYYDGWWWMRKLPVYEPLWGDLRFEAAMQKVQDEMAIQRANLAQRETATNF